MNSPAEHAPAEYLLDLDRVWMQIAVRAATEPHADTRSRPTTYPSHDSTITVATIHA